MSQQSERGEVSRWEWVFAGISALLVLSVIGVLLYEAYSTDGRPIGVRVTIDDISRVPPDYIVRFTLENTGDATAADLQIAAELLDGDSAVSSGSTTIGFLPARSTRSAAIYFDRDPSRYEIDIRPVGYDDP